MILSPWQRGVVRSYTEPNSVSHPAVAARLPSLLSAFAQTTSSTHSHLPCQVAMRSRSAKYLSTGSFQIIPNFSRLRIKRDVSADGRRVQRSTRLILAARTSDHFFGNLMGPENLPTLGWRP